jgi:hypothetical protein
LILDDFKQRLFLDEDGKINNTFFPLMRFNAGDGKQMSIRIFLRVSIYISTCDSKKKYRTEYFI